MSIYLGIDVAKKFHVGALVHEGGSLLATFQFSNNAAGYANLQQCLEPFAGDEVLVAMEATGHYGHALRDWLVSRGLAVHIFNPLKTNRFRDFYIQWQKNDERDAIALAHLLRFGERQLYHPLPLPLRRLKQMVRYRSALVQVRARTKNQLQAILDQVFPEYQQQALFSDMFGVTSLALLTHYPSPAHLMAVESAELATFLRQHSRGRLKAERAELIRHTAQHSIGSVEAGLAYAPILPAFINSYLSLTEQLNQSTDQIETWLNQLDQTLTTIPGIGPVLAATILAEVGQICRFPSPDHLVAFCGLALCEHQSGQARPRHFISRRGSARLREAFYQAALVAVNNDPHLEAYYQRRLARGSTKRRAILTVARKLVRISYALLKSGQTYQPPHNTH